MAFRAGKTAMYTYTSHKFRIHFYRNWWFENVLNNLMFLIGFAVTKQKSVDGAKRLRSKPGEVTKKRRRRALMARSHGRCHVARCLLALALALWANIFGHWNAKCCDKFCRSITENLHVAVGLRLGGSGSVAVVRPNPFQQVRYMNMSESGCLCLQRHKSRRQNLHQRTIRPPHRTTGDSPRIDILLRPNCLMNCFRKWTHQTFKQLEI